MENGIHRLLLKKKQKKNTLQYTKVHMHVIGDLHQDCVELNEKGKVSIYNYIQLHHVMEKTNIRPLTHKDEDYDEPPRGYNICHKSTYMNKILNQPGLGCFQVSTFLPNNMEKKPQR